MATPIDVGLQEEQIYQLQLANQFSPTEIEWQQVFHRIPPATMGNASILLEFLMDADAVRRKRGVRWEELDEVSVTTLSEVRKLHPKCWGFGEVDYDATL